MLAIVKILITLAVIVILLNRKVKMGYAMLAGAAILFVSANPDLQKLSTAVVNTATGYSTWEIIIALFFVMCLEYQLRTSGIIEGFMTSARSVLKSDRVLLFVMPSFLGFLPSLGGAIFSAPLVESASKSYRLTAEEKTTINYWFRHVWEYTNPIFSGMLLASQLSGIALGALIANMAWLTALSIVMGWVVLIAPISRNDEHIATQASPISTNHYRYILLAAGPILVNILLIVVFHLPASLSMGIVVAVMALIIKQNMPQLQAMTLHALDGKLLWGVAGIIFFQHILNQSGLIGQVAALLSAHAIPATVVIGIIAFVGGLLTGTSQGFVAISFPFIASLAPGDMTLAMIAFALGIAGQMLSPAHLCLLVTLDYFKADFLKSLRPVLFMNVVIIVVAYAIAM